MSNRYFIVKYDDEYSNLNEIKAGVPQASILGPTLYLLNTSDLPTDGNYINATFADDSALRTIDNSAKESTQKLQLAINKISAWTKKCGIKLNNLKSIQVGFANMQTDYKKVYIDNIEVPHSNSVDRPTMLKWNSRTHSRHRIVEEITNNFLWIWLVFKDPQQSLYCFRLIRIDP